MWFSKLSFHKMWSLLLTSSSSQSVLSARSFQVEISNVSCSGGTAVPMALQQGAEESWDPFLGKGCACPLCHQLFNTQLANVRHQPPLQHGQSRRESIGSVLRHWFKRREFETKSKRHLLQNMDTIYLWVLWLNIALKQLKSYFVLVMQICTPPKDIPNDSFIWKNRRKISISNWRSYY